MKHDECIFNRIGHIQPTYITLPGCKQHGADIGAAPLRGFNQGRVHIFFKTTPNGGLHIMGVGQAMQERKHELRKYGHYYRRTLAGLEQGPVQYTEAFFAEFIQEGMRPVPSYSDSTLVYEGHGATTILLPYDAQDNPVQKVMGQ
jgi:hypothetical protein